MQEPGERSQHGDGSGQRAPWPIWVAGGIMIGTAGGDAWLLTIFFTPLFSLHAPPQGQLAFGGATYALAIVAALLLGLAHKLPVGLLRIFLYSLILAIFLAAPLGSICIALALDHLAGWRLGVNGDALLGLLLSGVLLSVIHLVYSRRTTVHG
jgi:hypothetical protein